MKSIELPYGNAGIHFEYDPTQFDVVGRPESVEPLTDHEIGSKLDQPFDSQNLEELINPGETVLIAVPDATRKIGAGQIVNLLVRRLIAAGTMPYEISIAFATGLHRLLTKGERDDILTPFITQRIKLYDHKPSDLMEILKLGETAGGIPVELNRKVVESDHVIIVGGINFHYFAGFTGGRKLICPGLASKRSITASHSLAFDTKKSVRANGVGPGLLDGNPVNEAFEEIVGFAPPAFGINTFTNSDGKVTDLVCGNWKTSHREACRIFSDAHVWPIAEQRRLVIVSCGGNPYDINMVQAHKSLEMASYACSEGGTIIFLANCPDGAGSAEFEEWFEFENSDAMGQRLSENYKIGGQTAWSLKKKTERFEIKIVSDLPKSLTQKMGFQAFEDFTAALASSGSGSSGYIMPFGAGFMPFKSKA